MRGRSKLRAADAVPQDGMQCSGKQSTSNHGRLEEQRSPSKRPTDDELEITEVREVKRQRRLNVGTLSIPLNDAAQFWEEERQGLIYVFCPSDNTNLRRAAKHNYLDRVIYGMHANRVVEAVIADPEHEIPWSVPKVTVEFDSIDYTSDNQPYMGDARRNEGLPVDPIRLPTVQQMSVDEYQEAAARGDARIAPYHGHTFEHCLDMGLEWLEYWQR